MKEYGYTVDFQKNELGGYTATVPALPGVITEGVTLEETRKMVQEAIELHLEVLQEYGETIPEESELIHEKVTVHLHSA